MKTFLSVLLLSSILLIDAKSGIKVAVQEIGPSGAIVEVSWSFTRLYPSVRVTWDAISYLSEAPIQVTSKSIGSMDGDSKKGSVTLSGVKLDQQHMICVIGSDPACDTEKVHCAYTKIPRSNKVQQGSNLYLVFGPIFSTNLTITWSILPKGSMPPEPIRTDLGYRLDWRRIDGKIGGHPGHSSNVVSYTHFIKGLLPATRYEICVGETLAGPDFQACDVITTEEDLPGPPDADISTCYTQARGTHWRCDVSWSGPKKANGKIRGYLVYWKDDEGYSLLESVPRGAYCDPFCVDHQILPFHPSEVCVRAKTSKGAGWESCVKVADVSSRIFAFFDYRVFLIIFCTLFIYTFGLRVFVLVLRGCIRCLYRTLEPRKDHPV